MEARFASVDYFEVLGVSSHADDAEIRSAFRRLALIHHPDKATYDKEAAKERFQQIAEAYEVLSNDELRDTYWRVRSKANRRGGRSGGGCSSDSVASYRRAGGGASISMARRAAVSAFREMERSASLKEEKEWKAQQKAEQARYERLKESVLTRASEMGPDGRDAEEWSSWWKRQVGARWLSEAWRDHLSELDDTGDLKELLMRDVRSDSTRHDRAVAARIAAQATGDGGTVPRPKQRSRPNENAKDDALGEKAPLLPSQGRSSTVSSAAGQKQLDYLELITALREMGFNANDSESAARRNNTVESAVEWLASRGAISRA